MKLVSDIRSDYIVNRPKTSVHLTRTESCLYGILWERRGTVADIGTFCRKGYLLCESHTGG